VGCVSVGDTEKRKATKDAEVTLSTRWVAGVKEFFMWIFENCWKNFNN
jgi:hypothetical protein